MLVPFVTRSFAQSSVEIAISPGIDTTDKATREIYHFFKSYLNSRPDSIFHSDYWSGSSKEQYVIPDLGAKFIYPYVTVANSPYHAKILSIACPDFDCELRVLYSKNGIEPYDTLAIQSLYLHYSHNKWQFRSTMPDMTKKLSNSVYGKIRYHIASEVKYDPADMEKAANFVDSIVKAYDLDTLDSIDFYVAANKQGMAQLMGFEYEPHLKDGIAIEENNQIFTMLPFHPHEIVHILFNKYADAHKILREGIATLIAGSPKFDNSFKNVCRKNREIIHADTSITFQKIMANREDPSYDLFFYTTGAIICDQIIKYYGIAGLKEVLENTRTDQHLANLLEQGLHFTKDNLETKWRQLWKKYGEE